MARPSILKLFWELDVDKVTLFPYVADAPISSTIPPGTNFMYLYLSAFTEKTCFGCCEVSKSCEPRTLAGRNDVVGWNWVWHKITKLNSMEAGLWPVFISKATTQEPH